MILCAIRVVASGPNVDRNFPIFCFDSTAGIRTISAHKFFINITRAKAIFCPYWAIFSVISFGLEACRRDFRHDPLTNFSNICVNA